VLNQSGFLATGQRPDSNPAKDLLDGFKADPS
jgi:hypothetical protein